MRRFLLPAFLSAIVFWVAMSPALAESFAGKMRVSILPFDTKAPALEQYELGMMDSLIAGLQQVPQLIMIDRGRIERVIREQKFQQSSLADPATAVPVGKLLGAQVLVTGSLQAAGDEVRIVAQVVDVATGQIKAVQQVRGKLTSLFDLQDQLAALFIKQMDVTVTAEQQQRVARVLKSTGSLSAYDYYLKGRQAYLLASTKGYNESIGWYQKAIDVDRSYALAYAGLAETYDSLGWQQRTLEEEPLPAFESGLRHATTAAELAPTLAETHRALGQASFRLGKPGWEGHIRQALAINPNDAEAWFMLWSYTKALDDPDHEFILNALQLNPDLAFARTMRGRILRRHGRQEEALREFKAALQVHPNIFEARHSLGVLLIQMGRKREALVELERGIKLLPNPNSDAGKTLIQFVEILREELK